MAQLKTALISMKWTIKPDWKLIIAIVALIISIFAGAFLAQS